MEIVINIPDRIHYAIELGITVNGSDASQILIDAVKNGIPLPKGHGDLIDRKELLKQPMDLANYPSNYVQIAPTIIEADMESEE